jgi:hypothetical protein
MEQSWCIKIFINGTSKKTEEMFRIMENRTLEKQMIGIGFCSATPILKLKDNKLIMIDVEDDKNHKKAFENFINNMKIGDTIYLCKGSNNLLYKATINSDYIYDNCDYISVSTKDTSYNQIKNGWFWRHRRKIKNIETVNLTTNISMRQTIHKRNI